MSGILILLILLMLIVAWGAEHELSHGTPHSLSLDDRYLAALQRPDGAICATPERDRVVPYFANLTAAVMLEDPRQVPLVKSYLLWYLRHLNRPDHFGLHGTIYDYTYVDGVERAVMDYDSADSYAATFLSLVYRYVQVSGDRQFVIDHLSTLELVAGVLLQLQDRDGLIWAKPDYPVKYLMDNAENYRGLADFAALLSSLGLHDLSEVYDASAQRLRQAINDRLWDPSTGRYHWALGLRDRPQVYRSGRWYPDGVSQLYPTLYGIDEPDSDRAVGLYADLNQEFPRWAELVKDDPYPWALVAYVAALMGDITRAEQAIQAMKENHIAAPGQPYWYSLEHAFYLRTRQAIGAGPKGLDHRH